MYITTSDRLGQLYQASTAPASGPGSLVQRIRDAVRRGQDSLAIALAISHGLRDADKITNLVFWARHPTRWGQKLRQNERNFERLSQEWLDIRNRVVRSALQQIPPATTPSIRFPPPASPEQPQGPFGTLVAEIPGRQPFRYPFTSEDLIWTARFLTGEAGGSDDLPNRAILWAMLNRFALFRHKESPWGQEAMQKARRQERRLRLYSRFHEFLRAYSTTLQPVLKSADAAERAIYNSRRYPTKFQFVPDPSGATYPGTNIPKGQYRHHLTLQQKDWSKLRAGARSLAERGLKGEIPNPGIGTASQFANTNTILAQNIRRREGRAREISYNDWLEFTTKYRSKDMRWIGDILPELKQRTKNAFFQDLRSVGLPESTVRVLAPGSSAQ